MRFEDLKVKGDAPDVLQTGLDRGVSLEVTPGAAHLQRRGLSGTVIVTGTVVLMGLGFLVLGYFGGDEVDENKWLVYLALLPGAGFAALGMERRALSQKMTAEAYRLLTQEDFVILEGFELLAFAGVSPQDEGPEVLPAPAPPETFWTLTHVPAESKEHAEMRRKVRRMDQFTEEQRQLALRTLRQMGERELAELQKEMDDLGIVTEGDKEKFLKKKGSQAVAACEMLDGPKTLVMFLRNTPARAGQINHLIVVFATEADAKRCLEIFNAREQV